MKKHIPNIITLFNLTAGGIAAMEAILGNHATVIWLVIAAAVFDFADGLAARALHVKSDLGKELDSLADVVSFGLVPGLLVFSLLERIEGLPYPLLRYLAFLLPAFAAYRLAKFNLDTRQSESFLGVPTPAMALFFVMLPAATLVEEPGSSMFEAMSWITGSWAFLVIMVLVFSVLMVSEIPLLALKFRSVAWQTNKSRYMMLAGSALLFLTVGWGAVPLVIVWYIAFSMVCSRVESMR